MTPKITRTALLAAAATVLTACASTAQYPIVEGRAPGTGPQPARPNYPVHAPPPAENMPAPQARPTETVESSALSPVARPAPVESSQLPPPPEAEEELPPPPPPPPPVRRPPPAPVTKTITLAPGKVVDADGRPKTYTVKEGQGLDAVARAMGSNRAELAKINGLKEPYRLKPGQVLKGPAARAKAYVVAPSDTLFAIGRRFGVTVQALAEENEIETSTPLRVGQKIKLPEGYKDAGPIKRTVTVTPEPEPEPEYTPPPAPRPAPQPVRPAPQPAPEPAPLPPPPVTRPAPQPVKPTPTPPPPTTRPEPTRPQPRPEPAPARPEPARPAPASTPAPPPSSGRPVAPLLPTDRPPTQSDAEIAELGRGRFQWPVRGEVISGYGPKGAGRRNDGIDIAASSGTPVRAAAAGKVVYSGGDVPGFGTTVLVQHDDGWVTVYGNLQKSEVRMQQNIPAGHQIGTVGQSGGVPQPQLHFEVRYSPSPKFKAKAIDPSLVLPR